MVDFNLLKPTPDFYGNAMNAFQAGRQTVGQRQASQALQSGDYGGATNALYGAGMIDQGLELQNQQRQVQRQDQQDQRRGVLEGRQDEQYAAAQKAELANEAVRVAKNLRLTPADQRGALYQQQGVPVLQQLGVPQEEIDRVLADGLLSDQELDGFISQFGQLEAPEGPKYQVLPGPDGMVGYTEQRPGAPPTYTRLQEPVADPLDTELKRARIASTNRGNRGGAGGASSGARPSMGRSLGSGSEPAW